MNLAVWADIDSCRAGEQRFDRRSHLYLIDCTGSVRTSRVATKELFPSFLVFYPTKGAKQACHEAISGIKTITVYNNFYNPVYISIAQIIIIYNYTKRRVHWNMTQSIATPLLIRSKKSASQITREGRESGLSTYHRLTAARSF